MENHVLYSLATCSWLIRMLDMLERANSSLYSEMSMHKRGYLPLFLPERLVC